MKKTSLLRFIDAYHLGGQIESVEWRSVGGVMATRFVSLDKNMVGELATIPEAFTCDDMDVGIHTTSQLKKMLGVLAADIQLKPTTAGDKVVALGITDDDVKVRYMLADIGVIPRVPNMTVIPDFELSLVLDKDFISKFIKGASALTDASTFTVRTTDDAAQVVINHATINTNTISLNIDSDKHANIDDLTFSTELFTEMLRANSKFNVASFEIASKGLAKIVFETDEYTVKYYLVKQSLE